MTEEKGLTPLEIKLAELKNKVKSGEITIKSEKEIVAYERDKEAFQLGENLVCEGVKQIKKVISEIPNMPKQQLLSFMPTPMTRISPFFPMGPKQLRDRPIDRDREFPTPWGRVRFSGERLSIFDETVLLSILTLVVRYGCLGVKTTAGEICKEGRIPKGGKTYKLIWESIERLSWTRVRIEVWRDPIKRTGKPIRMTGTILSGGKDDPEADEIDILMNPYFLQMYAEGFVTGIDVDFRSKIKGDVAKALYRFFQSQDPLYKEGQYNISLEKLCKAINLPVDEVEPFRLRVRIRKAMGELRRLEYFTWWQLDKNDQLYMKCKPRIPKQLGEGD